MSNKGLKKVLEDLKWWRDTNEEFGVVYIPSNNIDEDIKIIKDYIKAGAKNDD